MSGLLPELKVKSVKSAVLDTPPDTARSVPPWDAPLLAVDELSVSRDTLPTIDRLDEIGVAQAAPAVSRLKAAAEAQRAM